MRWISSAATTASTGKRFVMKATVRYGSANRCGIIGVSITKKGNRK